MLQPCGRPSIDIQPISTKLWLDIVTNFVAAVPELDDAEYCINCGVQELRNAAGHRRWRRLAVVSINEGATRNARRVASLPELRDKPGRHAGVVRSPRAHVNTLRHAPSAHRESTLQ